MSQTTQDATKLAKEIDRLLQKKAIAFEEALDALERVADILDSGDAALEHSLELFERGSKLAQKCQQILRDAELRVNRLSQSNDGSVEAEEDETEEA